MKKLFSNHQVKKLRKGCKELCGKMIRSKAVGFKASETHI
jgi:hypothetical protein